MSTPIQGAFDPTAQAGEPITVAAQGSFAVGGTLVTADGTFDPRNPMDPAGQTRHADHARVTYQVPVDARPLPLLFWHGWWVDSSCWDTTTDGREGFRTLFLRRRHAVYLLDQARRGPAGKTGTATPISTDPNEQWFFNQFRLGVWPDSYDGGQFPPGQAAREQFFRAMVPDTGPLDTEVIVAGATAAIKHIGPLVLVTHSHAGGFGWLAAMRNPNIRAVVSIEPGSGFVFPDDEPMPEQMPSSNGTLAPVPVPAEDFAALTRVPIIVYYGDNIPTEPTDIAGRDNWRVRLAMAQLWVNALACRCGCGLRTLGSQRSVRSRALQRPEAFRSLRMPVSERSTGPWATDTPCAALAPVRPTDPITATRCHQTVDTGTQHPATPSQVAITTSPLRLTGRSPGPGAAPPGR